jgi:hypothetical protein
VLAVHMRVLLHPRARLLLPIHARCAASQLLFAVAANLTKSKSVCTHPR